MLRSPKLLALAAGLASATGFAPLGLWPLTVAALALLIHLVARAPRLRDALALGWLFGLGHFSLGLNWIAGAFRYQETMPVWLGWLAVPLLALYLAIYPALAAGLAWRGRRNPTAHILFFGAAWIVTEWLRAGMFTGFAWNPLGVIFVPTSGDGLARWIGTYGLSGAVVLIAGALVHPRRWLAAPAALASVLLLGLLPAWGIPANTARTIRIVQPNIGQSAKQDDSQDEANFARYVRLSGPPSARPRLLLWPEAAVPWFIEEERWARERIAHLLGPHDVLMLGADALIYDKGGRLIGARNSLFAMRPDSALFARYDKAHLVPYGEYLPMRRVLSAIGLSRLVPGDLDFWPGPGPQSYALPGFGSAGVQICYEIIFSGQVIDARHRPDFLFNPSNDAWFGAWGPPQHLAQARLRAIEEGVPVVRATPTGISAVIDARGRLVAALPLGKAGYIQTLLPAADPPTLFARFGNMLPFAFAALLALAGVALSRRKG